MLFNKSRSLEVMERHGVDALVAGTTRNVVYMTAYMSESILGRFYDCMAVGIMPRDADAHPTLVTQDEPEELVELVSMLPADPRVGQRLAVPRDSEGYIAPAYQPGQPLFVMGEFDMPYLTQKPSWIANIRTYDKLGFHYIAESVDRMLANGELTPAQRATRAFRDNAMQNFAPDIVGATAAALVEMGLAHQRLAFDNLRLAALIKQRYLPELDVIDGFDLFREVRLVKTPAEVAIMREGARIHDLAFEALIGVTRGGANWSDCIPAYKQVLMDNGAVWSGERGIIFGPAHMSATVYPDTNYVLRRGDAVVFDGLALYKEYCCDLARSGVIGEPTARQRQLYGAVLAADTILDDVLRPGVHTSDLKVQLFAALEAAGGDPAMCLMLPHPIGQDIFEFPRSYGGETEGFVVEEGMTMNVEILQLAPADGGAFHVEETMLIHRDRIERFGSLPKELIVLPD